MHANKSNIVLIAVSFVVIFVAGIFLYTYIVSVPKIRKNIAVTRYRRFKRFWRGMYDNLNEKRVIYTLKPLYDDKIDKIETYNLTLNSYDGLRLKGYFSIPYGVAGKKYPGVLLLHGYSSYGTPGWAHFFAMRGYGALSIDLRGHGRSRAVYNPGFPGLMTDGILHVRTFSMVKIIMDSLMSLKFLEHFKKINHKLIFVTGGSMGGGLSLIDAAMDRHVVASAADVPFLSDIPVQMPLAKMGPYMEVKAFLKKHKDDKAAVMRSLYYVDTKHFVNRIKSPVLMGVGLKDEDCPPEGSLAVYKLIKSKKQLFIAKNSGHVVLPGWNEEVFKFFAPYISKSIK
ncbi:acetylxylan esterase [Candidatus Acidulodesulfobacterium sp. H_13]|uniref:acetylxylan esterase n=1 Tax=Candidatus Acidulodesulfobacterium sp. H_13 TaxID=3395470 RepID=UPI003AF42F02